MNGVELRRMLVEPSALRRDLWAGAAGRDWKGHPTLRVPGEQREQG